MCGIYEAESSLYDGIFKFSHFIPEVVISLKKYSQLSLDNPNRNNSFNFNQKNCWKIKPVPRSHIRLIKSLEHCNYYGIVSVASVTC